MEPENLISTIRFCDYHQVDASFLDALSDHGLISFVIVQEAPYIPLDQVQNIEKMIRLHYDLDINIEGIAAISHILGRVAGLQQELRALQNRLDFFEK